MMPLTFPHPNAGGTTGQQVVGATEALRLVTLTSEAAMAVPVQTLGTVQLNPFDISESTKPSLLPRRSFTEKVSEPGIVVVVPTSPISWISAIVTDVTVTVIGEKTVLNVQVV